MGKGRQAAKTEIERLDLSSLTCRQGVTEVAKMCAQTLVAIEVPGTNCLTSILCGSTLRLPS